MVNARPGRLVSLVTMPHLSDTADGIAMNEYIMIRSNRKIIHQLHTQEAERKERETW